MNNQRRGPWFPHRRACIALYATVASSRVVMQWYSRAEVEELRAIRPRLERSQAVVVQRRNLETKELLEDVLALRNDIITHGSK